MNRALLLPVASVTVSLGCLGLAWYVVYRWRLA